MDSSCELYASRLHACVYEKTEEKDYNSFIAAIICTIGLSSRSLFFPLFPMMNAVYTNGSSFIFLWGLHVISVIAFFIGVLLLLFWAFKHLSANALWKWGWILVVVGTVLCLFTIPAWPAMGMMGNAGFGVRGFGMMGAWQNVPQGGESSSQQQEEADGKALYDKLQAKQITCTDLSDNDFELIGEYLMGQRAGANHEQMNGMITQMMGDDAPMHIFLARNATGCGTQSSPSRGGMMRGFTSSASR